MTSPVINESFLQWDAAQVSTYINSILSPDQRPIIGNVFLDNNIDGSLLPFLTTEHLKEVGIMSLQTRLLIKKQINELITQHYKKHSPPKTLNDPDYKLNHININNNYVSIESLNLSTVLMQDMMKKISLDIQKDSNLTSPMSPAQDEIKKLSDNFTKLKTDLIPVIRLLKDSKPLPTPTLDPGPVSVESQSYFNSHEPEEKESRPTSTLYGSNKNSAQPSPLSNRFSSGTILSMGTGKIIPQSVPKLNELKPKDFKLKPIPHSDSNKSLNSESKPKLSQEISSNSTSTIGSIAKSNNMSTHTVNTNQASHSSGNEPLKQLRASTDDSCLKILQQAMKRHHIPRDDWSRYVLVICYGDKERILKLAEKPVVIFKELQELGKHPAIMLRQLAETTPDVDYDNSPLYEDARIGQDIPGGLL
ncbi:unnamed protein product [Candida verbasci]|uniref:Ste50p n=1 Tax=Candida verbasci TaxID=1227364 RepID=A0A9W4TY73_9ASCO|nr:unnamed protein product [Candida verbasci]